MTLLDPELNAEYNKEFIQQLLFYARDFAYNELGPGYQRADRESRGRVMIPTTKIGP